MVEEKKFEYKYKRTLNKNTGFFDINSGKLDENDRYPRISTDIKKAFPGIHFIVRCDAESCKVIFDEELSSFDKKILDKVIENYKKNN